MSADLLTLHVRRKSFPAATAPVLTDVCLTLGTTEVVALLGPSGCGKTTLLRIVAGLDRDFAGAAEWRRGPAPRIGMVFQQPLLLPWLTVRQNLRIVLPRPELMAAAEALLATMGLAAASDMLPAKLSLGMARRVAIVRALAIEPDLLLMDEPFVSLDPTIAAHAREVVIAAWRARPQSILLVTHDATEAAAMADRVLLLSRHPGRVAAEVVIDPRDRRGGRRTEVAAAILRAQIGAAS